MTGSVAPHVSTVSGGPAAWWIVFSVLSCTLLVLCGVGEVTAVTLVNPGTDVTPAGAKDIASTGLNVLTNYLAPLGGLGMLLGAGGSFARNRQSGITAGPSSLAVGGVAMIFAPRLTSELMTSGTAAATFLSSWQPADIEFSPSPVMIGTMVMARYLWRHRYVAGMSLASK